MRAGSQRSKSRSGPLVWPILLVVIGGALLVSNFLLIGDFRILDLWPALLVVIGAYILLRGDLLPDQDHQPFAITRGRVEAATLQIDAGEIDVALYRLPRQQGERLIAGQFARQSRPILEGDAQHAHLKLLRWQTPWLAFADWEMGLSTELPWRVYATSHLGQIVVDMSDVIVHSLALDTGVGDIRLVLPHEAFEPIVVRSTLGDIHITAPDGCRAQVRVRGGRFFGVQADENRYIRDADAPIYMAFGHETAPVVKVVVEGTFGNLYLS